ncbi:unnamed protein product [Allacma fusca]|uniref:Protoporphyrinogen oxidase n=1 Tax=Allacma fusca TaxID=39272 RepID=A0A8J2KUY0_9HEXA|nr:unnamed protein product [Allacma fusca]
MNIGYESFKRKNVKLKKYYLLIDVCNILCSHKIIMACVTTQVPRHTVAILGGGIAGLSAAYYINRKYGPSVRPVIFEASGRSGGWVQSFKNDNSLFEVGPRTIRPAGVPGMSTLDLIEEIGLDGNINYVPADHPSAKTRFIHLNGRLVRLPMELATLWKTVEPFDRPVSQTLLKEIFIPRKKVEDDSLHGFVSRRFGQRIADTVIDPLVRGVCAGDARKISAKFIFGPGPLGIEQKYGSVVLGGTLMTILRRQHPDPHENFPNLKEIGTSTLATTARSEGWSVWTLEAGLESFPVKLKEKLTEAGVAIHENSSVKSIIFDEGRQSSEVEYLDSKTNTLNKLECSHVISAIPSLNLASILENSKPNLSSISRNLRTIGSADVTVTNLKYPGNVLELQAFGFLVPSIEKELEGLLGVVFNTCSFPQGEDTILTVMSQGIDIDTIDKHIRNILGLKDPSVVDVRLLSNCIPQYTVGHYERVENLRKLIQESKLPLTLIGASYDGVSVNDCVFSGRKASEYLPLDSIRSG